MASFARATTSALFVAVARVANGRSARLRAKRMRVDTTTSDSGPVPRSHSPRFGSRLSRFIRGFLLANQIAQACGFFVVLSLRGGLHLAAKLLQLHVALAPTHRQRQLPGVNLRPMNPLEQRLQRQAERFVIVRAAEAALGAELL